MWCVNNKVKSKSKIKYNGIEIKQVHKHKLQQI